MPEISLRPIDASEFPDWRQRLVEDLSRELVDAGEAEPVRPSYCAAKVVDVLMPRGLGTPGHHVLVAEEHERAVGTLWVALKSGTSTLHVFDLHVEEELRSLGYGRAIMEVAESWAGDQGASAVTLDLFTSNTVARGLYLSMGYSATAERMRKRLS